MHSFVSSLSFLLSLFLLPLLQPSPSLSHPTATSILAHAADIDANLDPPVYQHLIPQKSVDYQNTDAKGQKQKNGVEDATRTAAYIRRVHPVPEDLPVGAGHHGSTTANPQFHRKHVAVSRALSNATEETVSSLSLHPGRRAAGAQFTNYVTGLGACGTVNKASDFVVALNLEQWDNGAHCYAPITITINGKSVQAQIVDSCEKCGYNNLDLTDGLFSVWANILEGTLHGEWEYGSGAPPPPPPPPKTTSTPPPPKPTTSKVFTTTSHSTKTSTRTSASVSTTSSISLSSTTSSADNGTNTVSAAQPSQTEVEGNLDLLYLASLGISGVLLSSLN